MASVITTIIIFLIILYIIYDVNYFIRRVYTMIQTKLAKKLRVTDTTTVYGICTTQDIDIFIGHLNNARYIRDLDFARWHYYGITGFLKDVRKMNGRTVQGATNIRYRRTIELLQLYKIDTKLIWWDDKAIYLEHKFITLSDGFIRAVATSKQNVIHVNTFDVLRKYPYIFARPSIPEDLQYWLESIVISSDNLRKERIKNH